MTLLWLLLGWTLSVVLTDFARTALFNRMHMMTRDATGKTRFVWPPMRFFVRLADGMAVPRWYIAAWYDPMKHCFICLPFPLNFIARWWRNGSRWLLHRCWPSKRDEEIRKAQVEAYALGKEHGERDAVALAEQARDAGRWRRLVKDVDATEAQHRDAGFSRPVPWDGRIRK